MPTKLPDDYHGAPAPKETKPVDTPPEELREMIREDLEDHIRGREAAGLFFVLMFITIIALGGVLFYLYG